jgi:hypothetical protein
VLFRFKLKKCSASTSSGFELAGKKHEKFNMLEFALVDLPFPSHSRSSPAHAFLSSPSVPALPPPKEEKNKKFYLEANNVGFG